MSSTEDFLKQYGDLGSRVNSMYRADPSLPAPVYGDLARNQGKVPTGAAYRELKNAIEKPTGAPDEAVNKAAILVSQHLKGRKPADKRGFWTKVNEWIGQEMDVPGIGPKDKRRKFTDQALEFLNFTQHIYRTVAEMNYQETGEVKPAVLLPGAPRLEPRSLEYFSPKAWAQAWNKTRHPEHYFVGEDDIKTDLPEFGREVIKRTFRDESPEDIARAYGIDDSRLINVILESPEGRKYRKSLEDRQVSIGRDTARSLELTEESNPALFNLVSGTTDFIVAIFGEPDVIAGEIISGVRQANRSIPVAARKWGGGLDGLRTHPDMEKFLDAAVQETSPERLQRMWSRKGTEMPPVLADALASTTDKDVAWEVIRRAAMGANPEQFIDEIPRTSVWAKMSDRIIQMDVGADGVKGTAARLLMRAQSRFLDEPRDKLDPRDINDAFHQAKGIMNSFPKAFTFADRSAYLDQVAKAKSAAEVSEIVFKITDHAADALKVPGHLRTPMTRLFNQYWSLRAYNISTDTGDELSTAIIETANGMIEKAVPHLWSELTQEIPLWTPRELRTLRWAQGSFTKHFLNDSGNLNTLGNLWLMPHRLVKGLWVPLTLITRFTAYPLRIQIDNQLRLMALGKGMANPGEHFRAITLKPPFRDEVQRPAKVSFMEHPARYVKNIGDVGGIPEGVALGKSDILKTDGMAGLPAGRGGARMTAVPFESDPHALHGWQYMVEKMIEDPISRQFLRGESMESVTNWLQGDGNIILDDLIRAGNIKDDLSNLDEYLESVIDRITLTVHGNEPLENLMRQVASGEISAHAIKDKAGRKFLAEQSSPPAWVKKDIALDRGPVGMWARFQEVAFRYIMDIPDRRLARLPGYLEMKSDTEKSLRSFAAREGTFLGDALLKDRYTDRWVANIQARRDELADLGARAMAEGNLDEVARLSRLRSRLEGRIDQGPYLSELDNIAREDGMVTERMIRESAKIHASNQVIAILYDPRRRSPMERSLATQFPFLAAWREFVTTWYNIMKQRPQNIGRAARGVEFLGDTIDMDDPFYSEGFGGKGRAVGVGPFNWMVKHLTGSGTQFASPLDSFNLVSQNMYPAFGPMGQFLAAEIAKAKPEWEDMVKWVGGDFGVKYVREQGVMGHIRLGIDSLAPAWMRSAMLSLETLESNQDFANRVAREFQQLALKKWKGEDSIPWQDGEAIGAVVDQAERKARAVTLIHALAKMVWPGSSQLNYPQQPLIDRYRILRDTMGEEAALAALEKEVGSEAIIFLSEPLSHSTMPATRKARKMWNDPNMQKLADQYGGLFWALVENEVQKGEPFDYNVWKWQFSQGVRRGRAIKSTEIEGRYAPGWVDSAQISAAWRKIDQARQYGEAKVERGEISERQFVETMKRLKVQVSLEYPAWGASQIYMKNNTAQLRKLETDMRALSKALKGKESAKGLEVFLGALEAAKAARQRAGLTPDTFDGDSPAAMQVRTALNSAAAGIADKYPDFRPFYVRHLRFFLEPEGAETLPPVVELLEETDE